MITLILAVLISRLKPGALSQLIAESERGGWNYDGVVFFGDRGARDETTKMCCLVPSRDWIWILLIDYISTHNVVVAPGTVGGHTHSS